jgi:tetratricopeptide (TPR) repeat protein
MESRYVCLICHREIPSREAGCPYCKSRTQTAVGPSLPTLVGTFLVMLLLMALTGYFSRQFEAAAQARGRRHAADAQAFAVNHEYDLAIDEYREALTYARDNLDYRLSLAVALFEVGRLEEAEAHFTDTLSVDPTLAIANLHLARIAVQRGDDELAVVYYRRAIYGQWPTDPVQRRIQTRFELVSLLERGEARMQAVAELLELLEEEPDNLEVASRAAWSLLGVGAPSRALDVFEALVERDPRDAVAHSGIAEAEFELDHYLTARTHFRRALTLDPRLTHLEQRLELCNAINELDPTVRGLGRASRYERSVAMVRRALAVIDACGGGPGEPEAPTADAPEATDPTAAEDVAAEVAAAEAEAATPAEPEDIRIARAILDDRASQEADDEATERNLSLAERLWQLRAEQCPADAAADPALGRVLGKLAAS